MTASDVCTTQIGVSRTLIIGDVHGCAAELRELLDVCRHRRADRVVFVGDLVAKGPDSKGVVEIAREIRARAVLGNHDAAVLAVRGGPVAKLVPEPRGEHREVAESLSEADWEYLGGLPYFLRVEQVNAIVVHAGLVPGVPLEQQEPKHLISMRTLREDGTPSRRLSDGVPWASRWQGPEEVVFGHDAVSGLQRHKHAIGLDTGCVYGGALTAYVAEEKRLLSVRAKREWRSPGG